MNIDGEMTFFEEEKQAEIAKILLERVTKRPHPYFTRGQYVQVCGAWFQVKLILKDRMVLIPMSDKMAEVLNQKQHEKRS